jgi:SulP family sulfate permease
VDTIGTRFGAISVGLPLPRIPSVSLRMVADLAAPAFAIAMLGAIESLLSAVVSDGMISGSHRSDIELVAQGVANIVAPLFGGIPATGAIARTATNVKNGGRTPVAGLTHAVTLLLITLFFGRWAALIPMSCLAAILTVVSYQMSEWRTFRAELRSPRGDVVVLLVTFLLTVFFDLTLAIEVGMVLAAFLFLRRMADTTAVRAVGDGIADLTADGEEDGADAPAYAGVDDGVDDISAAASSRPRASQERVPLPREGTGEIPSGVQVFEIAGPLFFGAAATFRAALSRVSNRPDVLIIRMGLVPVIDSTGLRTLADVVRRSRRDRTLVILCELHQQPAAALTRSTVMDDVGEENLTPTLRAALTLAREHLAAAHTLTFTP